jgi:hypothetical protein
LARSSTSPSPFADPLSDNERADDPFSKTWIAAVGPDPSLRISELTVASICTLTNGMATPDVEAIGDAVVGEDRRRLRRDVCRRRLRRRSSRSRERDWPHCSGCRRPPGTAVVVFADEVEVTGVEVDALERAVACGLEGETQIELLSVRW